MSKKVSRVRATKNKDSSIDCNACGKPFQNYSRNKRLEKTIWKQ